MQFCNGLYNVYEYKQNINKDISKIINVFAIKNFLR